MARRMEIELTSSRDDETFTWRAAGAKEPRGNIAKSLLSPGAHPGDVVRVEADFELDGIVITAVLPSKSRSPDPERLEIKATARPAEGGVTTSLVERGARRGRPRDGGDRPRAGERPARGDARPERRAGPQRSATDRRAPRPEGASRPTRSERPAAAEPADRDTVRARRVRPARLIPGTVHKDALFATLPPEQQPIAEQLAVGGLPGLRRALEHEQHAAREAGRPAVGGEAIISLAEQILPAVREATWRDRAEAVRSQLETVSLRDLRAAVVGASPRDDAGRDLLHDLRVHLDERLAKLRTTWEEEMAHALDAKRVLQALRLSSKPPEPTARFPAVLVQPLAEAAGAALSASTPADRYLALLEAAAASPIRRSIKPAGLPVDPDGAVRKAAALTAGRIPALAPLLGLTMPPPPGPMPPIAARRTRRVQTPTRATDVSNDSNVPDAAPDEARLPGTATASALDDVPEGEAVPDAQAASSASVQADEPATADGS